VCTRSAPSRRAQWLSLGLDEAEFLGEVGLSVPAGEKGFSVLEQIWARPTAEVNGISGGYTGEGAKTVIPAEASAKNHSGWWAPRTPKRSARNAGRLWKRGCRPMHREFLSHGGDRAVSQPSDSRWVRKSMQALSEEWGREAVLIAMGGSIPIVTAVQAAARHG
jgi:hypothetical protein